MPADPPDDGLTLQRLVEEKVKEKIEIAWKVSKRNKYS